MKNLIFVTLLLSVSILNGQALQNTVSILGGSQNGDVAVVGIGYGYTTGWSGDVVRFNGRVLFTPTFLSENAPLETPSKWRLVNALVGVQFHVGRAYTRVGVGTALDGEIGLLTEKFVPSVGYQNYKNLNVADGDFKASVTYLLGGFYNDGAGCYESSYGQVWTLSASYLRPVKKGAGSSLFVTLAIHFGK